MNTADPEFEKQSRIACILTHVIESANNIERARPMPYTGDNAGPGEEWWEAFLIDLEERLENDED